MPRRPRELTAGGIYHIFNRGNDRHRLFAEPEDSRCFLNHLGRGLADCHAALYHER